MAVGGMGVAVWVGDGMGVGVLVGVRVGVRLGVAVGLGDGVALAVGRCVFVAVLSITGVGDGVLINCDVHPMRTISRMKHVASAGQVCS